MRTEVTLEDLDAVISGFSKITENLYSAREILGESELKEVLLHINTFKIIVDRLELSSEQLLVDVQSQVNEFAIGIRSRSGRARDLYARYGQKGRKSRRKRDDEGSQ